MTAQNSPAAPRSAWEELLGAALTVGAKSSVGRKGATEVRWPVVRRPARQPDFAFVAVALLDGRPVHLGHLHR